MIKRFTTFSFVLLFFTLSVFGQERIMNPVPERVATRVLPTAEITPRAIMDTLTPPSWSLACSDQAVNFTVNGAWGSIGGNNEFGDTEKAQRYSFSDVSPVNITETWVFFATAGVVGDADVRIKVYSANGDGAPDVLLGTSDPVKPSSFVLDDQMAFPTSFSFSTPALVEVTDFFVSVDFSDSYNNATDTLGMFMSSQDCGSGDDSWEKFGTGEWFPISNTDVSWGLDSDFWILPILEFEDPSNTNDVFAAKNGLQIFPARPNPAYERVDLPYELSKGSKVTIEVYAADGRLIERMDKGQLGPGSHVENYTVSNLPAGSYVYGIITEEARIMSRFMVNK
ncbi:MAG: T9SS type A sorting domain-containing protein [Saprospiraceae bacterium]|nr:T9SS type A sorting domain-containing protein [Saprospiraceae bacterium]